MDSSSFSSSANVVGLATGSITIFGLFVALYRSHLPGPKYKDLEQLLQETESIYESTVEANLLLDEQFREDVQDRLAQLRDETYEHRRRAYGATTFLQQYKEFFDGLSFAINRTSHDIKAIRALVITTGEVERRRLRQLACGSSPSRLTSPNHSVGDNGIAEIAGEVRILVDEQSNGHAYPPSQDVSTSLPVEAERHQDIPSAPPSRHSVEIKDDPKTASDLPPTNDQNVTPARSRPPSPAQGGPPDLPDTVTSTAGTRSIDAVTTSVGTPFLIARGQRRQYYVMLHNYLQENGNLPALSWEDTTAGPPEAPVWTCVAYINGVEYGNATASRKVFAREEAARRVLENPSFGHL